MPGWWVSRGRDDDWIKSENSLRCDTKAIEDNVRAMCTGLIAECIVVGTGRPSPVLFIEPAVDIDHHKLKKEILRKTRHFHSRRYLHERITSPDMIVVVPRQTLPRTATKGNIRRKAVEEAFKDDIDRIFGIAR
jgi:acyl-coenzyme A synthetase/AMP-(fatty) acid ligase